MAQSKRRRILRRSTFVMIVLILLGLVASWVVGGRLVAPSSQMVGDPPADFPATSISLDSESGSTVAGWHVRSSASKGVVVLLHPLRGSRLSMLERARFLFAAGYSIVMIDLQAHGESPGEQITLGHLEKHDVRATLELARRMHAKEPIGVVGCSLGGASALLASPLNVDAMVLESVYPNVTDAIHNRVADKLGFFSGIPANLLLLQLKPRLGASTTELRPIDHLPNVGCPVLLISGAQDRYTTATETKEMFTAAREPKELWLVEGAEHVDLYEASPEEYKARVLGFLEEHLQSRSSH